MRTLLALIALLAVVLAACSGGPGPTTQPTLAPTAAPTSVPTQGATEPPAATADPLLVSSFCDPFASEILSAWPPLDADGATDLDLTFRAWSQNPNLTALTDDLTVIVTWLAVARMTGTFTPTTTAAESFGRIEAFAAENC